MAALRYAWLTIKHRWYVFLAGIPLRVPLWRLLTHDLSKFYPSELRHYGRQFFGKADDPSGFVLCWTRHQNRNDHHWEWWIPRTGHNRCEPPYPDGQPIPMSVAAIREMVADWMGASRAYSGQWPSDDWPWLEGAKDAMRLHLETREILNDILHTYGWKIQL